MSGSSTRPVSLLKRVFTNEGGQLAVLIALIFQVLFILFAMVINVGLIIHDKINLQNAVDLGAYYGAERQAEAMNEIAHINYQIRQDYKLMTWRYRVMGAFGSKVHPARTVGGNLEDVNYQPPGSCGGNGCPPFVCMGHNSWKETRGVMGSNVCFQDIGSSPPLVADVPFVGGIAGVLDISGDLNRIKDQQLGYCAGITPMNWKLAAMFVIGFRLSVAERKKMIQKIASDISQPDWTDAHGDKVRDGILNTIKKNLTAANADPSSFSSQNVQVVNGLTLGGCGADTNGLPYWLSDIHIDPHMPYMNLSSPNGACSYNLADYAAINASGIDLSQVDPSRFWSKQVSEPPGLAHSSRGVEKNPWCVAYMGVKAQTRPRKPFAPLGQAIVMEARSFAEPFGGRIGPWDKDSWSQSADTSSGNPVDALAVPRGDSIDTAKAAMDANNPYFPNYSRFPGDKLGLKSALALGLFRDSFANDIYQKNAVAVANYVGVGSVATTADSLSWDATTNGPSLERSLELGAVAPDLFDAAYYSVDTDYYHDYFTKRDWGQSGFVAMSDEGYRVGAEKNLLSSNIGGQIAAAQRHPDVSTFGYYLMPKVENLLTGWTQGKAVDYDAASTTMLEKFGHCQQGIDAGSGLPNAPGNCIAGGRVGYSIRIVHKAYLNSSAHQLGGADTGQGPLKNAPGETL